MTFKTQRHWGPSHLLCIHSTQIMTFKTQRHWGPSHLQYPPDMPVCGFFHELCPRLQSGYLPLVSSLLTVYCSKSIYLLNSVSSYSLTNHTNLLRIIKILTIEIQLIPLKIFQPRGAIRKRGILARGRPSVRPSVTFIIILYRNSYRYRQTFPRPGSHSSLDV